MPVLPEDFTENVNKQDIVGGRPKLLNKDEKKKNVTEISSDGKKENVHNLTTQDEYRPRPAYQFENSISNNK